MRAAIMALRPASAALNLHAARRTGATPARHCWRPVSASAATESGSRHALRATRHAAAGDAGGGLKPELRAAIDKFVNENKVVLFMKGTKQFPQCGFSNTCVQVLNQCAIPYETVNILEDEALRSGMKEYSAWPTFPQLYVGGSFYGGCDITVAAFQDGSLKEALEKTINS